MPGAVGRGAELSLKVAANVDEKQKIRVSYLSRSYYICHDKLASFVCTQLVWCALALAIRRTTSALGPKGARNIQRPLGGHTRPLEV